MQKKSFFLFVLVSIIGFIFFLFLSYPSIKYDYADIQQKIKINSHFSGASIFTVTLPSLANSWVLSVPKSEYSHDIQVFWEIDGVSYKRTLDMEELDNTQFYYSFPLVTQLRKDIRLRIISTHPVSGMEVVAIDTTYRQYHVGSWIHSATALDAHPIVSRQEWGADESFRFLDQTILDKNIQEWEMRNKTPRIVKITPADQELSKKDSQIGKIISGLHPESFSIISKIRYENGRKLIWPITKSKRIDRIILHHTAENIDQNSNDELAIMRAIYIYHARTRGWGDIGYNYVIGRSGTVYEGRAGGDYVEGAHAYMNNLGTVGVAMMGNFETEIVPDIQLRSLEDLLVFLAKKYGINVLEETTGFRKCDTKKDQNCTVDVMDVRRLHAHRDVGYTSCSGKNFYALMDAIRNSIEIKVGKVQPVDNASFSYIDPLPPEDQITYILDQSTPQKDTKIIPITSSLGGRNIKIKLSYPYENTIQLSSVNNNLSRLKLDSKILRAKGLMVSIGIVGNNQLSIKIGNKNYTSQYFEYNSPVIRIDSWQRNPSWDTTKKYNDNLFRSKIIIRNIGGKLVVVNELPLEDYLRGLGEVSNTDHPEKIKTILVAARTYAQYYMESKNRKYNTSFYDGSDDPDSFQRYLGYSYEMRSPNVSREVKNTLGQVITYGGKIIKAWYFSVSNGRTKSYKEYCEKNTGQTCIDIPYLQSVPDIAGIGKTLSGHGVGISGIGASVMAEGGKMYNEIIQYYMNGVAIEKK